MMIDSRISCPKANFSPQGAAMSELKTRPTNNDVKAFLGTLDNETKREDCYQLLELMHQITGEEPRMWGDSIVGFGSYHYRYASGREGDWFLVGFSPRKKNLSLYIMAGFDQYETLLGKLGKHKLGKSCLYINKLEDVDQQVLGDLVKQSVDHMRATNPPGSV
jgi:hypothetical protein